MAVNTAHLLLLIYFFFSSCLVVSLFAGFPLCLWEGRKAPLYSVLA